MACLIKVFNAFALTACSTMGTKVDPNALASFTKGKTTYSEVITALGEPNQSTVNANGEKILTYSYSKTRMNPATMIPLVGLFVTPADIKSSTVILNFDKNSVLSDYSLSNGQY
ncbi:conserved exported hypothetical protein [Crenothrix polyspora]|uniref:Lipoprotein SmpA/OmlA domain-containing protein n=2 Tax=Crenothrix polyspora TaxID=360316 RepID=A0A1R4H1U3_9GAMM|nr:conserved exported hypothetical protein [Crenothrix polyspora]